MPLPALPRRLRAPAPLLLLGLLAAVSWSYADADPPPTFLVPPYLQLPTPDGMTVMWETSAKLPGKVEYGPTRDLGATAAPTGDAALHEVRLTGLKPATTYYYRVRSGALVSEIYSFKTAPPAGTKQWRMALYGDSRSNPPTHKKVAEGVAAAKVDLIVHTGDIVYNGKNHDSWRKEFFEPLGPLARSTPWVSTIGNHERDSENYFSYVAPPGNERYYGFDYGNAHIVCLDSNAWIQKGRDSEQGKWLTAHLAEKRAATWTFVVFHHPLFSAHATRALNSLRWDWAPIFLDPANRVDGVLTGHDHFYARNWRMGKLGDKPQPGVLFLTSAGGGAPLYKCKQWDYVAREKSAHHFTLFEFDGDKVTLTARDLTGKEIDRYVLTKEPTPADEFCAYEVEELRRLLREGLSRGPAVRLNEKQATTIDASLNVPIRFAVPVSGELQWQAVAGWKMKEMKVPFKLEVGQALKIPLQAEVAPGAFARNPKLTIAFEPGRFRNRIVELYPFQLKGPERVAAAPAELSPRIDGTLDDKAWQRAAASSLLGLPTQGGRADQVRFLADKQWLYLGADLDDAGAVDVKPLKEGREAGSLIQQETSVALVLSDGKQKHTFALTPGQERYHGGDPDAVTWHAAAARTATGWSVEMAVPRSLFADWSEVRVNVKHRRKSDDGYQDLHLCPSYTHGADPERIPEVKASDTAETFTLLEAK